MRELTPTLILPLAGGGGAFSGKVASSVKVASSGKGADLPLRLQEGGGEGVRKRH